MNTQLIALYLLTQMRNQEKTYDELSDKTGIPKSSLQRYLTGEREIPIDRFKMICDALELDACVVLGWKEPTKQEDDSAKEIAQIISSMSPQTRVLAVEVLRRFAGQ